MASVRDEIIAAIRKSESTTAAKTAADEAVKQLEPGTAFDDVAKSLGVSRRPGGTGGTQRSAVAGAGSPGGIRCHRLAPAANRSIVP